MKKSRGADKGVEQNSVHFKIHTPPGLMGNENAHHVRKPVIMMTATTMLVMMMPRR
jgi:hypothetical protein